VDRQTGKGVEAGIRFAPLADNKFFGSKPGYENYRHDRTMEGTDKDGHFKLLTIPGKALVLAQVFAREKFQGQNVCLYRRAVPDPDDPKLFKHDKDDDSWSIGTADGLEFLGVENAVKVIDIKQEGETTIDVFVDRGVTAQMSIQDADGKPLIGAWVAGLTDSWPITYRLPEATATVFALDPEKPRTLALFHADRQLGGTVVVRGDEKKPVVAKLAPLGKVVGKLLDTDGGPLGGAEISVSSPSQIVSELYRFAHPTEKPVVTDREGKFTLTGVVPGVSFYLQTRKGQQFFIGKPKIGLWQVKPGETLDLGDRTMEAQR